MLERLDLEDGRSVGVRTLQAEDADALVGLFGRLSPESIRRRFLLPMKELDRKLAEHLAAVNHSDQEALAAIGDPTPDGPIVAVARYARTGPTQAELALAVQDDYQAVGLGRHLLGRLAGLARAHGFTELQGETLVENEPMLHLLRSSGYQVRTRLAGHLCEFSLLLS